MTTIAWDGAYMVADTLSTDAWGMREHCDDKIMLGKDFIVGGAGQYGVIKRWWKQVSSMTFDMVKSYGVPEFDPDKFDPTLLLVGIEPDGTVGVYRTTQGIFYRTPYRYFAIGSGRDYAMAAMYFGKTAIEAVTCAADLDNGTGKPLIVRSFDDCR